MTNGALVLEGGALRGVYTSGVLDILLQNDIVLSDVYGVSAGALNGLNYVAGQYGRAAAVNLNFIDDRRYLDMKRMATGRSVFNFDFMFGEQLELIPFDRVRFDASPQRFVAVATDAQTCEPVYFEKGVCSDIFLAGTASSSIPLLAPPVELDGHCCYDGGLSDGIPVDKAIADGSERVVLVLTRDVTYRDPPVGTSQRALYRLMSKRFPQLYDLLVNSAEEYNTRLEHIAELESAGRVFVIRPSEPVTIPRIERDVERLLALYRMGLHDAAARLDALRRYLVQ